MATVNAEALRAELRLLGQERQQSDKEEVERTRKINAALAKIQRAGIAKTEAAKLLGVHRTTLYRVYKV